jgi:hypothetical protein
VRDAQVQLSRNQVQRMQNTGPGEQYLVMVVGVQSQTHGLFTKDELMDRGYTGVEYKVGGDGQKGTLTQRQPGNNVSKKRNDNRVRQSSGGGQRYRVASTVQRARGNVPPRRHLHSKGHSSRQVHSLGLSTS